MAKLKIKKKDGIDAAPLNGDKVIDDGAKLASKEIKVSLKNVGDEEYKGIDGIKNVVIKVGAVVEVSEALAKRLVVDYPKLFTGKK